MSFYDGLEVRSVFFDISKAFDRVWHKGLLHKLKSTCVSGELLQWFKNYLTGRKQRVVLPGASLEGLVLWCATRINIGTVAYLSMALSLALGLIFASLQMILPSMQLLSRAILIRSQNEPINGMSTLTPPNLNVFSYHSTLRCSSITCLWSQTSRFTAVR